MKAFTLEQEIILAEILKKPREYIAAHPEINLTKLQTSKYLKMRSLLEKGVPLAYVLGYKWFYGNKFSVNRDVLIPRPETEQLVDVALNWAIDNNPQEIIDIGTGPGTIILSIAEKYNKSVKYTAVEISTKALSVAKKNKRVLVPKKKINFLTGNLLKPVQALFKNKSGFLITANLPYLSKKELAEPTIKHEPKLALYGGKKSYALIETLIKQIAKTKITKSLLLLEINYNQAEILKKIIKKHLPDADVKIHKDFSNYDRILEIGL